ncbi:hypothetical protein S40285_02969 [Stachybotrys chlorohalonatus IBT 40285]|uniref:DNA-directed RNA polymerase III subunit RPC9 n=1 Tax=Stachybotrys chlorohalonatus (strain IBT 40285) TaxID=1283841 RepID=A0A084QT23_STAC4|nr:hypothetical protein S40285_02969 [Stachybotrys chlorohalonata IBT 40285]
MKILESQNAVLTNYEVYQHLTDQQNRGPENKKQRHRGPSNLETVVRELLQYLRTEPGPLSQEPIPYNPESIPTLLERLSPYDLSKGEVVMIINLRPASIAALNAIVEEMSDRFSDEQQEELIGIIAEVLGQFVPAAAQNGEDMDVDRDASTNGAA